MDDPFEGELFNTLDRLSKSPESFSGMLEYFQRNKPDQWLDLVRTLMQISKRDYSKAAALGNKLEYMIDDYAEFMNSEPEL